MKKALFLLVASALLGSCASEKTGSSDPIENLVSYLDSKDFDQTHKRIRYEGGAILKTNTEYYCIVAKPEALKSKEYQDLPKELLQEKKENTLRFRIPASVPSAGDAPSPAIAITRRVMCWTKTPWSMPWPSTVWTENALSCKARTATRTFS